MTFSKHKYYFLFSIFLVIISCRKPQPFTEEEQDPRLSGGSQTVFDEGSGAYDHSFTELSSHNQLIHDIGDSKFNAAFVTAPSHVNPGIGPLYSNISCGSCHQTAGGGSPPEEGQTAGLASFFLLLSNGNTDEHGAPEGVPGFGVQLQNNSSYGKPKEGDYSVSYSNKTIIYPDGETVTLRVPTYNINNTYIPLISNVQVSPRLAPSVFGLGLLEKIGDATIIAMATQSQTDTNFIFGKANQVWNEVTQQMSIGRFGHKAERATIAEQVARALNEDIGITTNMFPKENCLGQIQYYDDGLHPELNDSIFNALTYYMKTIAVPARRNVTDATVMRGEKLFKQAKCSGCHRQTLVTDVDVTMPQVSNQTIHPYTDLLLHNMGRDLADGRPSYSASGSDWRTCPLWGIGLRKVVTGQTTYLHDGRARSLEEAILWHGGQAQFSKDCFMYFSKTDRQALIAFLNSL